MKTCRGRGFTLVELMVVISIISVLMAILLPALGRAKEQSRQVRCLANLHTIGQSIHIYANSNDGALVPGDSAVPWAVWGPKSEGPQCGTPAGMANGEVNLGYLLGSNILPVPTDSDSVLFCPSGRNPDGSQCGDGFDKSWGSRSDEALITYMYNNAIDGFGEHVQEGDSAVLSHKSVICYLSADGSSQKYRVPRQVFDDKVGPEYLYEAAARHGVCFPSAMLFGWIERGEVNVGEANSFLDNPRGWTVKYAKIMQSGKMNLGQVGNRALVSDVVGAWGGIRGASPNPPAG